MSYQTHKRNATCSCCCAICCGIIPVIFLIFSMTMYGSYSSLSYDDYGYDPLELFMVPLIMMIILFIVLPMMIFAWQMKKAKEAGKGGGGRLYRTGVSQTMAQSQLGAYAQRPQSTQIEFASTPKKSQADVSSYLRKCPSIYKELAISDVAESTGWNANEIRSLVESLIMQGSLKAKIMGNIIDFKREVAPAPAAVAAPTPKPSSAPAPAGVEAQVYQIARDTGYLDLNLISGHLGISNDNVIMVLYRMMDDFDGDVEGDKFKLFGSIKQDSIGKLIKNLQEKYK